MTNVLKPAGEMPVLRPDGYWDGKSGGGIRCSSEGQAASQYHDPASAYTEREGRSVASLMPSGPGVRGVIIPRATVWGGSRGFNPHKPRLMNIDPDIKGAASVVDVSTCDKDTMAKAYDLAWQQVGEHGDPRLVAAQAFRNLAVSTDPVGMGHDPRGRPAETRRAPLAGIDTYVVPQAAPGGGQLMPFQETDHTAIPEGALVSPSVAAGPAPKPNADPNSVMAYNTPDDPNKMSRAQYRQAARESSQTLLAKLGVKAQEQYAAEDQQQLVNLDGPPIQKQAATHPARQAPQTPPSPEPTVFQDQTPIQPQARVTTGVPYEPSTQPIYNPLLPAAPHMPVLTPPITQPFPFQNQNPFQGTTTVGMPAYVQTQPVAPSLEVVFEMEGWGQIPGAYHKVIRNGILLVLGWDKRWTTGKFFPPTTDKIMAVHVKGSNKVFYVNSTGASFEDGDNQYCILVISGEIVPGQ